LNSFELKMHFGKKTYPIPSGRARGLDPLAPAPHPGPAASQPGPARPIWPSSRAARRRAADRPTTLACVPRRGSRPVCLYRSATHAPCALAAAGAAGRSERRRAGLSSSSVPGPSRRRKDRHVSPHLMRRFSTQEDL
jgi:hypothetical protein